MLAVCGYFEISIHAPHTGRDWNGQKQIKLLDPFQSTRPIRGATFCHHCEGREDLLCQSTRPIRGATVPIHAGHYDMMVFQSTRPIRGATPVGLLRLWPEYHFNPRAPYGARLQIFRTLIQHHNISIHAPHTGRDLHLFPVSKSVYQFQSTRPIRGATSVLKWFTSPSPVFQSTRPIRGATLRTFPQPLFPRDFNPRAPYGARPQKSGQRRPSTRHFNPRAPYGARPHFPP